jgi:glucosyl-dolichyl phosphate glucuronosyltransferase
MKVSVVVCTYNRSDCLRRMLESLQKAIVPKDVPFEVIVVDNNSDDDTRFIFEEAKTGSPLKITYVFEEKRGISHARNRGIAEATGDVIAFTDDDVIVDKYWIHNTEKAFREHDAACVGGRILPIWESPRQRWLNPPLYDYLALLDHGDSVVYMDSPDIWGANFAVKSEMFDKYGLFDVNLGRIPQKLYGFEETEFLLRLQSGGEVILYYPSSVIYHCIFANKMSKGYFRRWRFDQGELTGILMDDMRYQKVLQTRSLTAGRIVRDIAAGALRMALFSKDRFDHELQMCFIFGLLSGRIKRRGVK